MKFNASTSNAFSFTPASSLINGWETETARRPRYKIRPFALEEVRPTLAERDDLARKQEIICAAILALCLIFTLLHCMTQLGPL